MQICDLLIGKDLNDKKQDYRWEKKSNYATTENAVKFLLYFSGRIHMAALNLVHCESVSQKKFIKC